jgi:RNA 2',3'-cyclic 3'-phosphodiesterase
MRLFVALEVPEAVRANLASTRFAIQQDLPKAKSLKAPGHSSGMRWVPTENFHITLKFIGQVGADEVAHISEELGKVRPEGLVKATFRGLGYTWRQHGGGVLWASLTVSDGLNKLAAQISRRLEHLGIPAEERDFLPHLTLGRFKNSSELNAVRATVSAYASTDFGSAQWAQFSLIESKLGSGGSQYTTVKAFRFAAMAAYP